MARLLWYVEGMSILPRPRRDFAALEARRMHAAQLFQQGHPQAEIVRRLQVSRPTAHRWYQAWRRKGRQGLRGAGRAGRRPRLDAAARREWRRIVPELLDMGVLSTVDGPALGAYCSAYSHWIKAEKAIQRKGLLLEEPIFDKRGEVVGTKTRRNPAIGISTEAMKVMKSFLIEFGLTPAARTKVKVKPHTEEEDPMEAFLRPAKSPERKDLDMQ